MAWKGGNPSRSLFQALLLALLALTILLLRATLFFNASFYAQNESSLVSSIMNQMLIKVEREFEPLPSRNLGTPWKYPQLNDSCYPFSDLAVTNTDGRLGNQIWKYASLIATEKCLGIPGGLNSFTFNYLYPVFKNIMPRVPDGCLNSIKTTEIPTNETCSLVPGEQETHEGFVRFRLHWYAISKQHVRPYMDVLRQKLQFRDEIMADVGKYFDHISSKYKLTRKEMIFIGIHIRRTDFISYKLKHDCKEYRVPDSNWFTNAMNTLWGKIGYPRNVVFFIASDDVAWARQNVQPLPDTTIEYASDFYKEIKVRDHYFDLAMLASCDHSIYDMGSYGFWSAFLTPGLKIYCSKFCKNKLDVWSESGLRILDERTEYLPGFIGIAAP